MNRRTGMLLLAAAALRPVWAEPGPPPEVQAALPGAQLQGRGRLRFLGLAVYDARLWTTDPVDETTWNTRPLALELEYARTLAGQRIAERSIEEIQRQSRLPVATAERWRASLSALFPDVAQGDRLTGLWLPGEGARFHFNGSPRGEIRDTEFARLFFGIWLSAQSSEPDLRERLLGRRAAR